MDPSITREGKERIQRCELNGYGYLAGALSSGEAPLVALVLNGVSADQKGSYLIKRLLLLLLAWCEASWGTTACQS